MDFSSGVIWDNEDYTLSASVQNDKSITASAEYHQKVSGQYSISAFMGRVELRQGSRLGAVMEFHSIRKGTILTIQNVCTVSDSQTRWIPASES